MTALAKALQWEETFDGSGKSNGFVAETSFGLRYRIDQYFGSDSYGWNVLLGSVWIADCDDPNAAKAKAQEDFELRIWACVAHPQPATAQTSKPAPALSGSQNSAEMMPPVTAHEVRRQGPISARLAHSTSD